MFSLAIDRTHTVLLVEFTDRLQPRDLEDVDRLSKPLAEVEAIENVVVDLRQVTEIEVPVDQLMERAGRAPILSGRPMVFVVDAGSVLGFSRQYVAHRRLAGHDHIPIVSSLEAAWSLLGIAAPTFR